MQIKNCRLQPGNPVPPHTHAREGTVTNGTGVTAKTKKGSFFPTVQTCRSHGSSPGRSCRREPQPWDRPQTETARRASEAQRGIGEGVEAFGLLGISVTNANGELKSSDQLLIEVAGAMEGLSAARQIELAEKLGLSGSIRLLQQGRDEVVRLTEDARALGVTTQKDAAIAAEFQDGLTRLWRVVKQIALP